ncbi:MAG: pyrroline-5-carboxylate reductase [Ectothiorhodospiraceae bacterium]|nr:pyrroline-5-carboxylate reductase [Chromatiales bacterium]MCP5157323.1 pyrroline-5-carboxylate reductase [Ectothiorhodospiraceae bacterium]
MPQQSIAFIGGGNMATSLVGGLIGNATPPDTIWVTDPESDKLEALADRFGVRTSADNETAVRRVETVVLAVKPQVMAEVVRGIAGAAREHRPLIVSIAAGVRIADLARWLGYDAAIVRTMPNTPALVGAGATGLCAGPGVSAEQRSRAEAVLRAAGITVWVEDEGLLDAVTAVSGSGPAYFFALMEQMEEAGAALGLDRETARRLVLQTALGAARIATEGDDPPAVLRAKVTSPGGTTQAALETFSAGGLEQLVQRALTAARDRAVELGDQLGRQ